MCISWMCVFLILAEKITRAVVAPPFSGICASSTSWTWFKLRLQRNASLEQDKSQSQVMCEYNISQTDISSCFSLDLLQIDSSVECPRGQTSKTRINSKWIHPTQSLVLAQAISWSQPGHWLGSSDFLKATKSSNDLRLGWLPIRLSVGALRI